MMRRASDYICVMAVTAALFFSGCVKDTGSAGVDRGSAVRMPEAEKPAGEPVMRQVYPRQQGGKTVFKYINPSAKTVYISGEFNNWSRNSAPMTRDGEGAFTAGLDIAAGTYLYKLIVDGDYIVDPLNRDMSPDGYGGQNSVLTVK
ncbi:MAG: glycogen-binding domain-containing protein [Elusimicrobia bacterium]|nr:glycogen-binding domain-containing protein [Elusimicrobiota bacterium]